ncbi:hypothetical protein [Pseudomonas koreensis]|uniref:VOC domain-containing protein n=1 Tax=Pseudomonas koreensis TaxID=198620 RepID=A0AA94ESE5_9PSED|nr:hypothetical protein [Pseudomonas koreensis]RVD79702.1 hypothetical protein A9HBioS_0226 [Pseudomonas koreensis]
MSWTFDHLAFNSADGQTLQDSFGQLLGLTPGRRPPFPFPGRWLYQDAHALVHVIEQPTFTDTALSHIAFRTDEPAHSVLQRVRDSGLPYQLAQVPEEGIWQVFVQMPGGLVIELDAFA